MVNRADSVEMRVEGLSLDPTTKTPIVVLRDAENKVNLPIWIGLLEATAIATELEKVEVTRPMTHDLLQGILQELETSVEAVEVSDMQDSTFFATIYLKSGTREISIDARPSDALALAIRAKCPIFVARKVIELSSVVQQKSETSEDRNLSGVSPEKWGDILDEMGPEDFKYKM